ncbi:hypothetical protein [Polaribacter sp. Asnod1-A03]|uniref:hypothetical protein n=1 Tax=Polaribacter sp. Asnod1-A03 TaxID=3160581 RepID=UPI00386C9BB0
MKITKMNLLKKVAITLTVFSFVLISCNKGKKEVTEIKEEIAELVDIDTSDIDEVKTRTYKMKDGRTIIYDINARGIVGFDDWSNYAALHSDLEVLKKQNFTTTEDDIKNLNYRIANLANTIPDWLKTEEVMEDVADIQKEYGELIAEGNASEDEIKENLEEVSEKFDDLKEELGETVEEYTEMNADEIEEFKEDVKEFNEELEEEK